MRNGSLPEYLKRLEWDGSMVSGASMVSEVYGDSSEPDLLRFMVEISRAMKYAHSAHVVHGDLKGANVLLDNDLRCVLADFGHSKDISQISCKNAQHAHGLRWQSPGLMAGHFLLTKENDVYAFGIACVEIVTFRSLPWPMMPDNVVKKLVLEENSRPPFPSKIVDRLGIRQVLERCSNDKVMERPTFSQVVKRLEGPDEQVVVLLRSTSGPIESWLWLFTSPAIRVFTETILGPTNRYARIRKFCSRTH
ncbi:kinase-like protein [Gymnopus androsaceus JB14]|uniref:Kinase-like protein n=1 Tax=Gymnopus androsaceus JB14 TaxID=1447944 RepID=A0A6A4HF60_9AGAR|nr:kinase-like protein [Gymnopus androsaceus JB14]